MTLGEALARAADHLAARGVDHPRLDAELLFARAVGLQRIDLYTQHDRPLTEAELAEARRLIGRRGRREPIAYVLGDWDFRRLTLRTDARALVPRPETEIVVERCLARLEGIDEPLVLDVGTGTGAIALAIAHERSDARVTATESSPGALALARENAEVNGVTVDLVETNLLDGIEGTFDLVVSNPPYVSAAELDQLEPEVRDWEPREALLDEGQTEQVLLDARRVLSGWLVLEVHEQRAVQVAALATRLGYSAATITNDLAARPRVVEGRWTTSTTSSGS